MTHRPALAEATLLTLLLLGSACNKEDPPTCDEAGAQGQEDALASMVSCYECNYEDTWKVDEYSSEENRKCYAFRYWQAYDFYCFEPCEVPEGEPESCCGDGKQYVVDQMEALGYSSF